MINGQPRVSKILDGAIENERVASAYLFTGAFFEELKTGAEYFIEKLRADKICIVPQGQNIKIDQIREIKNLVRYGPWKNAWLVVLIEQADALNVEAANSFLKILEEPPEKVIFVLLAEKEYGLPQTIISRCQKILFDETDSQVTSYKTSTSSVESLQAPNIENSKDLVEILEWTGSLAAKKEEVEQTLYDLYSRYSLLNSRYARIFMDTIKSVKRRANLKLALDVMGLKLWNQN